MATIGIDLCHYFLCLIVMILSISGIGSVEAFKVTGNVSMMAETDDVIAMETGDMLDFSFDIGIELEDNFQQMLVLFSGDTLVFLKSTNVTSSPTSDVLWRLGNADIGLEYGCNESSPAVNTTDPVISCVGNEDWDSSFEQEDGEKVKWALNMTTNLQSGNWTFNGSFAMQVSNAVRQGSLIRAVLSVWIVQNNNVVRTKQVTSNYVIIPAGHVEVKTLSALTQPILGILTTTIEVNSSRDVLSVVIGCLTPYENVSNEVMLTVQNMLVMMSHGVHSNTTEMLEEDVIARVTSTIGSYQRNQASLNLDSVPRDTSSNASISVTTSFSVRVEDYSQLKNGDVFQVKVSAIFNDNLIWVAVIPVTLTAPAIRRPSLLTNVVQIQQCPYDGDVWVKVKVLVTHDSDSTATAYNVTLNVYLPPYLSMISNTHSEPKENQISVQPQGATVRAQIARLTFSDPFQMTLKLDLDLDKPHAMEATHRTVVAESIYSDRWGNLTDLLTETVHTSLDIDKPCAKRIRWDKSGVCIDDACRCPLIRAPGRCAPCQEMWRCPIYTDDPHYEQVSKLDTRRITCEASARRAGVAGGTSCVRILDNPTRYIELSPRLGVITGQDSNTGFYYGIANNGIAHLVSKDDGVTWSSIFNDEYTLATSSNSFQWATFI